MFVESARIKIGSFTLTNRRGIEQSLNQIPWDQFITEDDDLLEVFRLVNNYLDPMGVFIFDFNTEYKYREILGERTIAEEREECSFIWENYYDEEDKINEYVLTLFLQEEEDEDLYRKYQEQHFQRGYTLEEMKRLLQRAGLVFEVAYDAYTKDPVTEKSERITVVAREKGKVYSDL